MPTLMARGQENVFGGNYNLGLWEYADKITEIIFETEIYIPITIFKSWDVSVDQNEDVMAYIIDDELGTSTYHLYIQSNIKLYANPNSSYLFSNFTKLTAINSLSNFNVSSVTNMKQMFYGCSSLTSLDVSSFDTSNVTNMSYMFDSCVDIEEFDFSNFDTSKVTNTSWMFAH